MKIRILLDKNILPKPILDITETCKSKQFLDIICDEVPVVTEMINVGNILERAVWQGTDKNFVKLALYFRES